MKAIDKIYMLPEELDERREWITKPYEDRDVAYIRKDALLEWAKAKKAELLNEELTDVAAGINMGMDMLIYKLEQL